MSSNAYESSVNVASSRVPSSECSVGASSPENSSSSISISQVFEETVEHNSLHELQLIVSHPFIRNHPIPWLTRFGEADDSREDIARKIYRYIQTQNGRHINLSKSVEIEPLVEPPSGPVVSSAFFEQLYNDNARVRKQNYKGRLQLLHLDAATANPSILLRFAAIANYWEIIPSLVEQGGFLNGSDWNEQFSLDIHRAGGDPSKAKTEWAGVYETVYLARYGVLPAHYNGESSGSQSQSHE